MASLIRTHSFVDDDLQIIDMEVADQDIGKVDSKYSRRMAENPLAKSSALNDGTIFGNGAVSKTVRFKMSTPSSVGSMSDVSSVGSGSRNSSPRLSRRNISTTTNRTKDISNAVRFKMKPFSSVDSMSDTSSVGSVNSRNSSPRLSRRNISTFTNRTEDVSKTVIFKMNTPSSDGDVASVGSNSSSNNSPRLSRRNIPMITEPKYHINTDVKFKYRRPFEKQITKPHVAISAATSDAGFMQIKPKISLVSPAVTTSSLSPSAARLSGSASNLAGFPKVGDPALIRKASSVNLPPVDKPKPERKLYGTVSLPKNFNEGSDSALSHRGSNDSLNSRHNGSNDSIHSRHNGSCDSLNSARLTDSYDSLVPTRSNDNHRSHDVIEGKPKHALYHPKDHDPRNCMRCFHRSNSVSNVLVQTFGKKPKKPFNHRSADLVDELLHIDELRRRTEADSRNDARNVTSNGRHHGHHGGPPVGQQRNHFHKHQQQPSLADMFVELGDCRYLRKKPVNMMNKPDGDTGDDVIEDMET